MERVDFRKYMDKQFLGHWDIPEGSDLILTIKDVKPETVKNNLGKSTKLILHFKEDYKPMICNMTNGTAISKVCNSSVYADWINKKISLYRAKTSAQGGTIVDCVRVRDYAPKADELICEGCGQTITDVTIDGKTYKARAIAENARTKFKRYLCYDCALAEK